MSCGTYTLKSEAVQALTCLGCMEHRGACSADDDSGDGAGIMTQIPWDLFKADLPDLNPSTTGCVRHWSSCNACAARTPVLLELLQCRSPVAGSTAWRGTAKSFLSLAACP